jgi:hypothetical protein
VCFQTTDLLLVCSKFLKGLQDLFVHAVLRSAAGVEFMVDKVENGQLKHFGFSPVSIFPPLLYKHFFIRPSPMLYDFSN